MRRSNWFLAAMLTVLPLEAFAEPLIAGASKQGATFEAVEDAFRARVIEAFPADTPLADVAARLTLEGFTMLEGYAEISKPGFPCRVVWRVVWTENDGMATDIDAVHDGIWL
jgi:hypothetical protein